MRDEDSTTPYIDSSGPIDANDTYPFYKVPDDPRLRIARLLAMYCFKEDDENPSKDIEALKLANALYDKVLLRGRSVTLNNLKSIALRHKVAMFDFELSKQNFDGIKLINELRNENYKPNKFKRLLIAAAIAAGIGIAAYSSVKIFQQSDLSFISTASKNAYSKVEEISTDAIKSIERRVRTVKRAIKQYAR